MYGAHGCRAGMIYLVQDRNDLEARVEREEQIREGLRLNALGCIHDEDGAFTGRQRPRNLVREIDVSGRIDEVELVLLAVPRLVRHAHGVQLDRDAALALQVERIEDL